MKKLIIAAAIVCAAAVSQAATATWNFQTKSMTYVYDGLGSKTGNKYTGTTAYAFVLSDTFTQQNVYSAFFADPSTSLASLDVSKLDTAKFALTMNGSGEIKKTANSGFKQTVDEIAGTKKFFLAVQDAAGNLFLSDATDGFSVIGTDTGSTVQFDVKSSSATKLAEHSKFTAGTWYAAQTVPEPTSGLLLLLGVAGLALRRRRA